jgi:tRNA(fMet)-specific endonuclease VapC
MIELLKKSSAAMKKVQELSNDNDEAVTTIVTAYELLRGASLSFNRQENLAQMREVISNIQVLDLTTKACEEAANIYADLKKNGTLIGEFDILIAAIAKTNKEAILTMDKHFESLRGLQLIKW